MSPYNVWRAFDAHTHIVNFVVFSASGELLASDDGGNVFIWSLLSGKLFQALPRGSPEAESPEAVSCCWGDDKELFVGYGDGEVHFFEHNRLTNRFERNARVRPGDHHVSSLAVHGNRLAGSSGNTVHCWRIEGGSLRHILRWKFDTIREIRTVHFVDRQSVLVTSLYEGQCIMLDVLEPSKPLWRRRLSHMIGEAALASDGRHLAITNLASAVRIYEVLPSGLRLWKEFLSPAESANNFPTQACFAEFQTLVGSGSDNGEVRLWDVQTAERFALIHGRGALGWRRLLPGKESSARVVQAISSFSSAEHHYLASACGDGKETHTVRVWRREYRTSNSVKSQLGMLMTMLLTISAVLAIKQGVGHLKDKQTDGLENWRWWESVFNATHYEVAS